MNADTKLAALRKSSFSMSDLPDTIHIPPYPGRRDEAVKPTAMATVDDIAFALIALNQKSSAIYREIEALRTVYDLARKNGAVGADTALDLIPTPEVKGGAR